MPASGPDGTQREVADRPRGAVGDKPRTGGGERRFFSYIFVLIEFLNGGGGLREAMSRRAARRCLPENEREAYAPKSREQGGGGWAFERVGLESGARGGILEDTRLSPPARPGPRFRRCRFSGSGTSRLERGPRKLLPC